MINVTITLPETIVIERLGARCVVNVENLTADMIARLVDHGLEQKVGDAAAGSNGTKKRWEELTGSERDDVTATAKEKMEKVRVALEAGNWGVERKNKAGVDPVTAEVFKIVRPDAKTRYVKVHGESGWKSLEESEIIELCMELFDRQTDEVKAKIIDLAETRIANRKEEKTLSLK